MYTDEHLNHYADRYVRHGLRDCGVTLLQYLADPPRYQALAGLLPRQRIAAGKALAEMSAPIECITIEPPVWCHGCGRMLVAHGRLIRGDVSAVCAECSTEAGAA